MALYNNTFYPYYGVSMLRTHYGRQWAELMDSLRQLPAHDPQMVAFTVTMRRIRKALNLSENLMRDPFSALDADAILDAFPGGEQELLRLYQFNLSQVQATMGNMRLRNDMPARRRALYVA